MSTQKHRGYFRSHDGDDRPSDMKHGILHVPADQLGKQHLDSPKPSERSLAQGKPVKHGDHSRKH